MHTTATSFPDVRGTTPAQEAPAARCPPSLKGTLRRYLGEGTIHAATELLSGGRANRVWRVDHPSGSAIVKLYNRGAASRLFPNSPQAEARILAELSGTGLAPDPIGLSRSGDGPVLVYRAVPGSTLAETAPHGWIRVFATSLAQLHRRTPASGYRRCSIAPIALRRGIAADLADVPDHPLARHIVRSASRPVRPVPPVVALSLLHGDPVPGNVVVRPDGAITLIDWQCPGRGDPVHDLALALSPGMRVLYGCAPLTMDEIERFWAAYGDPAAEERHAALLPVLSARIAAHCIAQAARGRDGYAEAARAEIAAMPDLEQ